MLTSLRTSFKGRIKLNGVVLKSYGRNHPFFKEVEIKKGDTIEYVLVESQS